jgi:hypothetical protein
MTNNNTIAEEFARTYSEIGPRDGWDRVQEYRRVAEYMAEHPNKGSTAVASALEIPRSRIRAWVDENGRPDPVRGLEIAADNGWITHNWDNPTSRALNILTAWTFSGGAISSDTYQPRFSVDSAAATSTVSCALNTIGIDERHRNPSSRRGSEIVPDDDASILGRILTAWGAPTGNKNENQPLSIPNYLTDAPSDISEDFARVYLANRAVVRTDRDDQLQIHENRSTTYQQEIKNLFETISPDNTDIVCTGDIIYIYSNNPHELNHYPQVTDDPVSGE